MNEARLQFNMAMADSPNIQPCKTESSKEIPETYDMRTDEARKNCIQPVRRTGNCTSGHVMAVVSTVEDRMCIQKDGTQVYKLSAQDVISCDKENYYCNGGYVTFALNYGISKGFIREENFPWTGQNTTCPDIENPERQNGDQAVLTGYCAVQGADSIKRQIIEEGPVIAPLTAYTDFLTYSSGTYYPTQGSFKFNGQNVVKIIGWG